MTDTITITTVVWPNLGEIENPGQEESTAMYEFRSGLLTPEGANNQVSTIDDTGTEKIAVRHWPSQEMAQQWIDFVTTNFNVTSAVINP
jgi:hypothetical protein